MSASLRRRATFRLASVASAVVSLAACSLGAASAAQPAARQGVSFGAVRRSMPQADPFTTAAMQTYLRTRRGDITAALYDMENHALYLYRPGVTEQTASIVKVDILETLLHQEQVTYRPLDTDDEYLATGMIEESDNDDATDLWDEVGGAAAVAALRLAGQAHRHGTEHRGLLGRDDDDGARPGPPRRASRLRQQAPRRDPRAPMSCTSWRT